MNSQRTLIAGAVVVLVLALVGAAVLPGAVDPPREERERPGPVRVADVTLQPTRVGGATTDLAVGVALQHYGNPTENVSVRVRAVDTETGFLADETSVPVGTLTGEGQATANVTLTVERAGGYRIEVVSFRDDQPTDSATATVRGLDALTPAYARSNVSFADEPALPPLSIAVDEAGANRTTLTASATLTNRGDARSDGLSLTVVLRQADSNLVADRTEVSVPAIRPGRTQTVDATVTVPSEYNYYVDAVLWNDGVVIDSARSVVNLAPTRTIDVTERRERVNISVSDFERGDGERPQPTERAGATSGGAPGFTAVVALLALLVAGTLAAVRTRRRP